MGCTKEMTQHLNQTKETVQAMNRKLRQIKRSSLHKIHDRLAVESLLAEVRRAEERIEELLDRSTLRHQARGRNDD